MNIKDIAATLAILGSGALVMTGCGKDKPATEVPGGDAEAAPADGGGAEAAPAAEGSCGGEGHTEEGHCGDEAAGGGEGEGGGGEASCSAEGSCGGK